MAFLIFHIYRDFINVLSDAKYYVQNYVFDRSKRVIGHPNINKPLSEDEFRTLSAKLYGNKYIMQKYLNEEEQMDDKNAFANMVLCAFPGITSVCDAGANRGYLMKAFMDRGIRVQGFDVMEDKSGVLEEVRDHYIVGSVLSIPKEIGGVDCVVSKNVFEHIPINWIDTMAEQLKSLNPQYMAFEISKDMLSDGHITLKGTRWWAKKFFPEYRIDKNAKRILKRIDNANRIRYCDKGAPKGDFNKVPGILFLKRKGIQ